MTISNEAIRRLTQLRSGAATAADHAALAAWRSADPAHEHAFQEAEGIWDIASALEVDSVSGSLYVDTLPSVWAPQARQPRRASLLAFAASLLLAVGVTAWLAAESDALWADYGARTGEVRRVTLADGSVVSLNANASMDVDLAADHRRVVLRSGKAFFKVTRDAARAFEVAAGATTVTVLGTAFEVDRRGDGSVAVAVSEHAVAVRSSRAEPLMLNEGESLLIDAAGTVGRVTAFNASRIATWREGRLVAEPQSLGEVIEALSHYYRGWIVVDDAAARIPVNAVLDLTEPAESLRTLSAAVPIRVQTITPYLIVIRRT